MATQSLQSDAPPLLGTSMSASLSKLRYNYRPRMIPLFQRSGPIRAQEKIVVFGVSKVGQ